MFPSSSSGEPDFSFAPELKLVVGPDRRVLSLSGASNIRRHPDCDSCPKEATAFVKGYLAHKESLLKIRDARICPEILLEEEFQQLINEIKDRVRCLGCDKNHSATFLNRSDHRNLEQMSQGQGSEGSSMMYAGSSTHLGTKISSERSGTNDVYYAELKGVYARSPEHDTQRRPRSSGPTPPRRRYTHPIRPRHDRYWEEPVDRLFEMPPRRSETDSWLRGEPAALPQLEFTRDYFRDTYPGDTDPRDAASYQRYHTNSYIPNLLSAPTTRRPTGGRDIEWGYSHVPAPGCQPNDRHRVSSSAVFVRGTRPNSGTTFNIRF